MKKIFSLIFAGGLTISSLSAQEKLNVLYVGGSANIETFGTRDLDPAAVAASAKERTADFIKFLRQHFTKVTAVDGKNYSPGMSAAVDVTIFDGMPPVVKERVMERDAEGTVTRYEEAEYLPSDFKYPALCIASYSKQLGNALGSKNDWMCLCLDNYAYNWNKSHPIFNGPFKVNLETEMYPTPESAVEYGEFYDYVAPKELEMFRVSKYSYKDPGHRNIRIGMVSRPWGYLDSPEAEVISGGVSAKSIDAVAIGRHGNMFHWGFAAAPADMLPATREILANAIVYTAKACTQPIIARKINEVCFTRPMIAESKFLVSQKGWKHYNEMNRSSYESMKEGAAEAEAKKAAGQELDEEDKMYLEYFSHMTEPVDVTYAEHLKQHARPGLFELFGTDEQSYMDYYDRNAPYFYGDPASDKPWLEKIDQEARELGIANNDIRLLDTAITMMEKGGDEAVTGRILAERYTLKRFSTPTQWRQWFDKNRNNMFFTEAGGFKWLVNTYEPGENDYSVIKE